MVPIVRCLCEGEDSQSLLQLEDADGTTLHDNASPPPPPLVIQQTMKWGLLPPHQKTLPGPGEALRTINARSDVLLSGSPLWSRPFSKGQRCIVFVQGFYEWLKVPKGNGVDRIPHFIGMTQEGLGRIDRHGVERKLMALAGLWEKTLLQGDTTHTYTFTIITTDVGAQLDFLHDRQPLILPDDQAIATWLDPKAPIKDVTKLVTVYQGPLEVYKVPKEVGKVGNDDKGFLLPVEERKDGLMAAFGRGSKVGKVASKKDDESSSHRAKEEDEHEDEMKDVNTESNAPVKREDTPSSELLPQQDSLAADELIDATKQAEQQQQQDDSKPSEPASSPKSSRFSPEPFNPPLSPNRPNGGYSLDDDPHGGLTKYGKKSTWNESNSPNKKRVAMGQGALEQQFKKQKVKNEALEEFQRQAGLDKGGVDAAATNNTATQSHSPPQPPRTPSKNADGVSKTPASPPSAKSAKSKHTRNDKPAGTDIRSFFAKSP